MFATLILQLFQDCLYKLCLQHEYCSFSKIVCVKIARFLKISVQFQNVDLLYLIVKKVEVFVVKLGAYD